MVVRPCGTRLTSVRWSRPKVTLDLSMDSITENQCMQFSRSQVYDIGITRFQKLIVTQNCYKVVANHNPQRATVDPHISMR